MIIDKKINLLLGYILACVMQENYNSIPSVPVVDDDGVYLDIYARENNISTKDFDKISKFINKIITGANKIECLAQDSKTLSKLFNNDKYISEFLDPKIQQYLIKFAKYQSLSNELIEFTSTNVIKAFKILSLGGSYWKGDEKNEQLTRIRLVGFENKSDLETYLKEYEERLERDHRTIGKNADLFTFNNLAGQGLPFWLPNGAIIRKQIRNFLGELEFKYGFESVYSPILGSIDLYKTSGHWDHYRENMFTEIKVDNEELVLRPMTCPHHILIYKRKPYSYKQLPIRLSEESMLHRYESSGGLTGFERVREMTLEDSHIFCTSEQIADEVKNCYNIITEAIKGFNLHLHQVDLSLHDPKDTEKFHQDDNLWSLAENGLRKVLKDCNIEYVEKVGEAAFYGPKIDFQVKTVLGRIITMSTIQLDFLLPEKFDITYKNKNLEETRAVMIHLGIVGTYERLLSIILEQTKGILPLWMTPIQVISFAINNDLHLEYVKTINSQLRASNIRANIDERDDRIAKKIREAQIAKIPYQIIIGDDELKNQNISYREYGSEDTHTVKLDAFIKMLKEKIDKKN